MVIISHDRHFLNQVCTHMADLDYATIRLYPGTWDDYIEASTQARERAAAANAKAKERVADLQSFVRRFSANKSKSKQATSRLKMIDKIKIEEFKPSSRQYPWIRFDYDPKEKLHRQAVELDNVVFGYDGGPQILKGFTATFDGGDRVAIIGENGVGKTTFLKLLVGELTPQHGSIKWAEKARLGYFAQDHSADFDSDANLTDWISGYVREGGYEGDDAITLIRGTLGRLLFGGDDVKKAVRVLSGGEQGRMMFGRLMLQRNNVLLLDEPTNHMDMESIESLNAGLDAFDGTLFFVSHDREFVSTLATRVLEVRGDGQIIDYRGGYEDYLASQGIDD
jgi:ATPase subunit of ABC transporter with duplicated ATPase domains